jgi:hypothetical protein
MLACSLRVPHSQIAVRVKNGGSLVDKALFAALVALCLYLVVPVLGDILSLRALMK